MPIRDGMNAPDLVRKALARRLFRISQTLEKAARESRDYLDGDVLADLWKAQEVLTETVWKLDNTQLKWPEIPEGLEPR